LDDSGKKGTTYLQSKALIFLLCFGEEEGCKTLERERQGKSFWKRGSKLRRTCKVRVLARERKSKLLSKEN